MLVSDANMTVDLNIINSAYVTVRDSYEAGDINIIDYEDAAAVDTYILGYLIIDKGAVILKNKTVIGNLVNIQGKLRRYAQRIIQSLKILAAGKP